jgi:hypothetical protein
MPKPHPFAPAPANKDRARAVSKPYVTVYGYARVSTGGQSVDAQTRQLRAAGPCLSLVPITDHDTPSGILGCTELSAMRPSRAAAWMSFSILIASAS